MAERFFVHSWSDRKMERDVKKILPRGGLLPKNELKVRKTL